MNQVTKSGVIQTSVTVDPVEFLIGDLQFFSDGDTENFENLIEAEADWEDELDRLGAAADEDMLMSLLQRAPNKNSEAALYVSAYLADLAAARLTRSVVDSFLI